MIYFFTIVFKYFVLYLIYEITHYKFLEIFYTLIVVILISAYISLLERQVIGILQQRFGPSITGGFWALLQPIADGFKLLTKEIIIPSKAKLFLFFLAPIYTFVTTLLI